MARRKAKRPTPTLSELRQQRGWTTHDVARRTGLSERTIRYVEHAQVTPTLATLRRLAQVYDLEVTDLVPEVTRRPLPDPVGSAEGG